MKITVFADAGKVSNFDRMWKRPSRPRCLCDGYMLLLARPSGLAIYCSLEMHIFRKFEVRAVYLWNFRKVTCWDLAVSKIEA